MGLGEFLSGYFYQIWRIFEMPSGLFGLTFADILLGGFVVLVGIKILKDIFGLGGMTFQKTTGGSVNLIKRYKRKNYEDE